MPYEEHLNDVSIQLHNFQSSVAIKGWEIDGHTPKDGNCCFRAVSNQLERLEIDSLNTFSTATESCDLHRHH